MRAAGDAILDVGPELSELVGADVTDWAMDRAILAGYRIESLLGAGGMAAAFLAHVTATPGDGGAERPGRPAIGARCVLKVLFPSVVVRESAVAQLSFKKEVVALARLAERLPPSPFVVRYLDAGLLAVRTAEATRAKIDPLLLPWCALELVDGRPLGTTLEERLQRANGPLEPARAASLIDGIVRGVRAVHAVGLVHRDLKPSNVLVCGEPPNELPKITDFGVARAHGVGDTFDVTVGTTGYAALEQLEGPSTTRGRDTVGPWSDVFALGAIFYEILTRAPMYEAPTAMGFVGKVLARNFDHLADRGDLGNSWQSAQGRALAARWDALLLRATSPRSPGGSNLGNDLALPMRHRDVDELLDELEPLLDATRALSPLSRVAGGASVARVDEHSVAARRWEWTLGPAAPSPLSFAACRPDGAVLGATAEGLLFWNGERWSPLDARPSDESTVGVLHGGAGTFVVVRSGGEVEVLPGGGGSFSLRLPFAVRRATALAGHPLGTCQIVVHAAHGEWTVVRMRGRVAAPFARLGSTAHVHAMVRAFGEEDLLVVGGRTVATAGASSPVRVRRGDEAFLSAIDPSGRVTALAPLPGASVSALAVDADGAIVVAGHGGVGRIDLSRAHLSLDAVDELEGGVVAPAFEALVALADGQVWGFAGGLAARRFVDRRWRAIHVEPAVAGIPVLAAAASGARVWAVHADGRILSGRLAIGS